MVAGEACDPVALAKYTPRKYYQQGVLLAWLLAERQLLYHRLTGVEESTGLRIARQYLHSSINQAIERIAIHDL